MACLLLEGFDRYGPANSNSTVVKSLLTQFWSSAYVNTTINIVSPLSSTGQAITVNMSTPNNNGNNLVYTFPSSFSRLIVGFRFAHTLTSSSGNPTTLITFLNGATYVTSIMVTTAGQLQLRSGLQNGTLVNSGGSIIANTTYHLEADITFGTSGAAYAIYLNGSLVFSGTGATSASGSTVNSICLGVNISNANYGGTTTYDDLYVFDTTGSRNNAVLLTSPRIEFQLPTSDVQQQWSTGPGVLGSTLVKTTTTLNISAGQLFLRPFTPVVNCTINSVSFVVTTTNGTARFKGALYADNGNTPVGGALLGSGTEVVGCTANVPQTSPFAGAVSLTAGTKYWLGFAFDVTLTFVCSDNNNEGVRIITTYATAPPNPCPAISLGGIASALVYGTLSGISVNWPQVADPGGNGDYSYNFESTVNDEDLFGFPALTTTPDTVHAAAVVGLLRRSDTGSRTVDLRAKSGSTTGSGSLTGIAAGTTYLWYQSLFETNPDTGAAWTGSELNAGSAGVKIAS